MVSERIKYLQNNLLEAKHYFWRTTQQQEIDLLEEAGNKMSAFEFKWGKNTKVRFPLTFTENYKAKTMIVSPGNVEEFLIKD